VETVSSEVTSVYVIDDLLSEEQCSYFIEEINKLNVSQSIVNAPYLSDALWSITKEKLVKFNFSGFNDLVTVTKTKMSYGKHVDDKYEGDKYKLLVYLNDSAGTSFYGKEVTQVEGKAGRGVLFDISIEHGSQRVSNLKYVIGVRPR